MWKNFLSSIGLLAIAMISALYSSNAIKDDRILASAVSALAALGIATWVALMFVPRLARGVDWEWLPFLSHYHVTREGWIYFGALVIVVFAAVNTANNLLYMVLSGLLAVLLLSGFLSSLNFRLIKFVVRMPSHCFAREPFAISVQVHNVKRLFPTFSLQVEPVEESALQFSTFHVPFVRHQKQAPELGQAMLAKRGRYELKKIKVSSRYPFGFFVKARDFSVDAECICYPEIVPQEQINFSIIDTQGANHRFQRGSGQDLYMVRDYLPSDSARHVHWKASAKTSILKTREYSAEEDRRVILVFDRFCHPDQTEEFEELVSYAASLAYHFTQAGIELSLVSDEWSSPKGHSQTILDSILQYLALVKISSSTASLPLHASQGAIRLSLRN
jgi:uncharacterized protein (DUF58 family)